MELLVLVVAFSLYWLFRSVVLICIKARRIRKDADAACTALSKSAPSPPQRAG